MSNIVPFGLVPYLETRARRTGRAAFHTLIRAGLCPGSADFDSTGWRLIRNRAEKLFYAHREAVEQGTGPVWAASAAFWRSTAYRQFIDMTKAAASHRTCNVEEART